MQNNQTSNQNKPMTISNNIPKLKPRPELQKFANWIMSELSKCNCTYTEAEAMYQDFSRMSETRLKKLSINFNL